MKRHVLAALAAAAALAPASHSLGADTIVLGCNEGNPGEVGVRELVADVGDTVRVAVTLHTLGAVDAFSLDIAFPTNELAYVRTERGELTADFGSLEGTFRAADGAVQVSGFNLYPIPAGALGRLAWISFEVVAAGSGAFTSSNYLDDIRAPLGYVACESAHPPTSVSVASWGRVKSLYD